MIIIYNIIIACVYMGLLIFTDLVSLFTTSTDIVSFLLIVLFLFLQVGINTSFCVLHFEQKNKKKGIKFLLCIPIVIIICVLSFMLDSNGEMSYFSFETFQIHEDRRGGYK